MSTKKTKTAVATVSSSNGIALTKENVPALISQLESQLEALEGNVDKTVSTDVMYNGQNISKVEKVSTLLEISASIHAREKAYSEEISRYDLGSKNVAKFKTEDRTASEWSAIISKAINELLNAKAIKNLRDSISKLSNHVDAETKLQRELAGIMQNATQEIQ